MIRVQEADFDMGAELERFMSGNTAVGGVCSFVGLVRDMEAGEGKLQSMTLEHYPAMTEKALAQIETEARSRWPLFDTLIIHRFGRLRPGDRIVLVAVASAHRKAAFESCEFLIDWLKTKAPFWKSEATGAGARWVEAKDTDDAAAARWRKGEG